jgi:hypothetical protein
MNARCKVRHLKERLPVIDLLSQYPKSDRLTGRGQLRRAVSRPYNRTTALIRNHQSMPLIIRADRVRLRDQPLQFRDA